jgi:transcriptional regulator with XRE-family HTH domain
MSAAEINEPAAVSLAAAVYDYCRRHRLSTATIAARSRIMPTVLQPLLDGEATAMDPAVLEALARSIELSPDRLDEYRLAIVLRSLSRNAARTNALFLESLSTIERELVAGAELSDEEFGPTVRSLLARDELTQQELAESIGVTPSELSRAMNGREQPSVELLELVGQAFGTPPETFIDYRRSFVEDWLRDHPSRADELFEEVMREPALTRYRSWRSRTLPDPRRVTAKALIKSLLEIVEAEGPVVAARVYELRLAAAGLTETRELYSLLNRAIAAASRYGLVIADDERGDGTQKYRVLRLPDHPAVYPRTLGTRRLWQVPPRELESVLVDSSAWKQGASVADLQETLVSALGATSGGPRDVEHVNRTIMRLRQGGHAD